MPVPCTNCYKQKIHSGLIKVCQQLVTLVSPLSSICNTATLRKSETKHHGWYILGFLEFNLFGTCKNWSIMFGNHCSCYRPSLLNSNASVAYDLLATFFHLGLILPHVDLFSHFQDFTLHGDFPWSGGMAYHRPKLVVAYMCTSTFGPQLSVVVSHGVCEFTSPVQLLYNVYVAATHLLLCNLI